jgi:hypothetical protein
MCRSCLQCSSFPSLPLGPSTCGKEKLSRNCIHGSKWERGRACMRRLPMRDVGPVGDWAYRCRKWAALIHAVQGYLCPNFSPAHLTLILEKKIWCWVWNVYAFLHVNLVKTFHSIFGRSILLVCPALAWSWQWYVAYTVTQRWRVRGWVVTV